MLQGSLKKMLLPAAVAVGLVLGGAHAASAAELSKEQIEEIVHDYIVNHADVILKSVDDFQRRDMEKRQSDALRLNHEELFNNEKSPFIGNPDGDVTMIEFFDYNCHYCKQIFPELRDLAEKDKKLKIIFKDLPILGPTSESSARWALAAQMQGKYFPFHQKLMEHKGPYKEGDFESYAKDVGLDMAKVKKDVEGTEVLLQIERNRSLASHMNFSGTPSFVINEQAFSGVPNHAELTRKIAEARSKSGGASDNKDEKSGGKKED
jgi:protein-disulfide isomerase